MKRLIGLMRRITSLTLLLLAQQKGIAKLVKVLDSHKGNGIFFGLIC